MKRFDYDENEDFQDENLFRDMEEGEGGEMTPQEYAEMVKRQDAISLLQIEVANKDLNQRLLFKVVAMLQRSFWWKFRSVKSKIAQISLVYNTLKALVEPKEEE